MQAVDNESRISHMVSQAVIVVSCMYSKTAPWMSLPTSIVQFMLLFLAGYVIITIELLFIVY